MIFERIEFHLNSDYKLDYCPACNYRKVWVIRPWSYNTKIGYKTTICLIAIFLRQTYLLVLSYYIQRFIKQKSKFVVKKLVIKKKMVVL